MSEWSRPEGDLAAGAAEIGAAVAATLLRMLDLAVDTDPPDGQDPPDLVFKPAAQAKGYWCLRRVGRPASQSLGTGTREDRPRHVEQEFELTGYLPLTGTVGRAAEWQALGDAVVDALESDYTLGRKVLQVQRVALTDSGKPKTATLPGKTPKRYRETSVRFAAVTNDRLVRAIPLGG